MRWWSDARERAGVFVAVVSAGAIAGLIAGWSMDPPRASGTFPSDVVASRFPTDWTAEGVPAAAAEPPATAGLFNPVPLHALASVDSRLIAAPIPGRPSVQPRAAARPAAPGESRPEATGLLNPTSVYTLASADSSIILPPSALGYADPNAAAPPAAAPAPATKRVAPRPPSNKVFNDAQIASIKARLKLTREQERYWPAVEAALRSIAYKINSTAAKGSTAKRLASVDPNGPEVQRLKTAATPLIMMLNEEQKEEVRQLAHLIGLQRLASMF